ncbi:nicotinamide N-methyltransferase-like [Eleutherodactylus coqui]|uniref:nicotinamide N-methyltransferase-like n=1 Tax=Eleutherodactylus coqui TaxID=57060 RepID=UPI0034634248
MSSSCKKVYGIDAVDHQNLIKQFFSPHVPYSIFMESTISRIRSVYKAFSTGIATGKTLIDFCHVPILIHLFPIKDFVENITLVQINDNGVQEIEKWLNKHPDACDWSHTAGFLKEFKGIRTLGYPTGPKSPGSPSPLDQPNQLQRSDESDDEEETTRAKIKVLKWDLSDDNPAEALSLPKADIVTCMWFLEAISRNHDEYRRNLRNISTAIKPEGFLMMQSNLNSSYFKVGEETFHYLPCDESFHRKMLCEEGFAIKHCEMFDRVINTDEADHEGGMFIVAQKVRGPQTREIS